MPDEYLVYNEEARRQIKEAVERVQRMPRDRRVPQPIAQKSSIEWLPFRNDYAGTIPAFGIMKVTGGTDPATETGGTADPKTLMLTCTQPDATITSYAFNGPQDVAQNAYGLCQRSPVHNQVLYDTGTPAAGDQWGLKSGQFTLTKGGIGTFIVDYPNDTTNKIMCGQWFGSGNGIPVYNNSGSTIPAYGVMQPSSMSAGVVTVVQPSTTLVPVYLINGPTAITNATNGVALRFGDVKLGTLGSGTAFGPTPSSFSLTSNNPVCLDEIGDDGTNVRGVWRPITVLTAVLAGTLNGGGTATANATVAGTSTTTGFTLTVSGFLLATGKSIASGTLVIVTRIGNIWAVTGTTC